MVPASNNNSSNNGFIRPGPSPHSVLPPWMSGGPSSTAPSVMLTLSPAPWPQSTTSVGVGNYNDEVVFSELAECCRELEEGQRAWAAHRKEAAWRLKRVELQLESEKACRRREKREEIEMKVRVLREEEKAALERIEGEYREQLAGLRREAEGKEQKLAEQWAARHSRLTKFLDQMGCRSGEPNNLR